MGRLLSSNLLVNLVKRYPEKKFYYFSYEEARKAIGLKLLMILSGETLSEKTNSGAYVHYLQDKRLQPEDRGCSGRI